MPTSRKKIPLSKSHPALAKQAHGWDPNGVTAGSSKKLLWKCSKHRKHIWEATPGSRTFTSSGCPFCSGKRTLKGYNDLGTKFPDIAIEAFGWDPTTVSGGEKKDRKWKCRKNKKHIWVARTANRTYNKTGCPYCSGQKVMKGDNDLATMFPKLSKEAYGWDPTKVVAGSAKNLKWKCSKDSRHVWVARVETRTTRKYGCPFCSGKKLAKNSNELKTTHPTLAKEAFEWDPRKVTASSTKKLKWKCGINAKHVWEATPSARSTKGIGCPNCAGKANKVGTDDLATKFPKIAKEAHGWNPSSVLPGSGKKLEWKCSKNSKHIWIASPSSRTTRMMSGCPYCVNRRILKGDNDLATTHPKLSKEAYGWNPSEVSAGMDKIRRWRCSKDPRHIWSTRISHRALNRTDCPNCAVSGFHPNEKGYLYLMFHSKWKMLQIGITNFPAERLRQHRTRGWKLIELSKPIDGHAARKWETLILKALKANGADLANHKIAGKFDGYTEAWSRSTYPAKSLEDLKALGNKYEKSKN